MMRTNQPANGARKRPVAPQPAVVARITVQRLHARFAAPLACDEGYRHALPLKCVQRTRDKTLRTAIRRVALTHQGDGQWLHARNCCSASSTCSTRIDVRHSETLPWPQPSSPHGRHE